MQYISPSCLNIAPLWQSIILNSYDYFQEIIRQYKILRWHVFTYTLRLRGYLSILLRKMRYDIFDMTIFHKFLLRIDA